MSIETYREPVARLLTYGNCWDLPTDPKPNYVEQFGFTAADIPELIRMATDTELNTLDSDRLEVWAPVHAWRALGQLKAEAAIEPLISLFETVDDDAVTEEMPDVFGQIGAAAFPALANYLADTSRDEWALIDAANCVIAIAEANPDHRDQAIEVLSQQLEQYAKNGSNLNSTLIDGLVQLKAVDAFPLLQQVFATGEIDEFLTGTLAHIQVELGLKQESDFSPAELKPKLPAHLAEIQQNFQHYLQAMRVQERQSSKPAGFGGSASSPSKKNKKKKKK